MTAEKRQIPINRGATGAGPGAGAPAGPAAHASARGAEPHPAGGAAHGGVPPSGPAHPAGGAKSHAAAELQALQTEVDKLAADLETLAAERDALAAERDDLKDQLLRLRAEFDNYRKRAARESLETRSRAQCDLLIDVLPVLDNLERALDAAEHHEEGKVVGGVRMTRDMFVNLLACSGIEEIEGVGAQFDPQVHDAIAVQPSDQEEGKVAAVLERGYRQGDRILRPARVVVSAGPGD